MPLASRSVDVWCAFTDEIRDEWLLQQYDRLLSAGEQQRRFQFVFPRDQHRYLVTRALVRSVLSRYVSVASADWMFVANAYGRPAIANDHPGAKDLSFNISHTDNLIVLAVTQGGALGIDTENTRVRPAPVEIAARYFAPSEATALWALPKARQSRRFFEYWTLKESYVKARSIGLSVPLDKFSVQFRGDREVALWMDDDLGDTAERWRLWQFAVGDDCVTAVCAERTSGDVPRLVVRRIVPLGEALELEVRDMRTSI